MFPIHIDIKKVFGIKDSTISATSLWLFLGLAVTILGSTILAITLEEILLLGIPAVLILVYQTIVDFKKIFYLLLFTIPLSTEFYFPNGLGTDLPTEPLTVGLMLAYGLFIITHWKTMKRDFLLHPITLFLLFHVAWIAFTMFTSSNVLVSFKFLLAKIWYVAGYFFLAGYILKTDKDITNLKRIITKE